MKMKFFGLAAVVFFFMLVVIRPFSEQIHVRCTDKESGQLFHLSLNVYAPYVWWADDKGQGWIRWGDEYLEKVPVTSNDSLTLMGLTDKIKLGFDKVSWSAWVVSKDQKHSGSCVSL
jgi:hypothetical protein